MNEQSRFFTFGNGGAFHNMYVEILPTTDDYPPGRDSPREIMARHFGAAWTFEYSYKDFKSQPEEYGLQRLVLIVDDYPLNLRAEVQ